jgi:hypothetical protein
MNKFMDKETKSSFEELIGSLKEYFTIQKKILKLEAAEKAGEIFSEAISVLIVFAIFLIAFAFASFALAYALSEYIGRAYSGFAIVGALYIIIAILAYVNKDRLLKTPIMNRLIKSFFRNDTD